MPICQQIARTVIDRTPRVKVGPEQDGRYLPSPGFVMVGVVQYAVIGVKIPTSSAALTTQLFTTISDILRIYNKLN
jgi:hypothetical protein